MVRSNSNVADTSHTSARPHKLRWVWEFFVATVVNEAWFEGSDYNWRTMKWDWQGDWNWISLGLWHNELLCPMPCSNRMFFSIDICFLPCADSHKLDVFRGRGHAMAHEGSNHRHHSIKLLLLREPVGSGNFL